MGVLERETFVPAPLADVFAFFGDPQNLARITPSSLGFEIVEAPRRALRRGDRIRYRIRLLGIPVRWTTRITEWIDGKRFVDEQERGPYKLWRHTHELHEVHGGVLMTDHVHYEVPFGALGRLVSGWWVRRNLRAIFDYRGERIREIFPRG